MFWKEDGLTIVFAEVSNRTLNASSVVANPHKTTNLSLHKSCIFLLLLC